MFKLEMDQRNNKRVEPAQCASGFALSGREGCGCGRRKPGLSRSGGAALSGRANTRARTLSRAARIAAIRERYTRAAEAKPRGRLNFARSTVLVRARCESPRRAAPRWRLARTGQLNRSGGFAIFCLSTMAAAVQKWLSARNTRHYTPPVPARNLFLFLSPDPRARAFSLPSFALSHVLLFSSSPFLSISMCVYVCVCADSWRTFDEPNARRGIIWVVGEHNRPVPLCCAGNNVAAPVGYVRRRVISRDTSRRRAIERRWQESLICATSPS